MKRLTRKQAIKAKCLDCVCGQRAEIARCPIKDCPLYPFRMGKEDVSLYDIPTETQEDETDE